MPEPDEHDDLYAVRFDAHRWRAQQPAPPPFDRSFQRMRRRGRARGILAGAAAMLVVVVAVVLGVGSLPRAGTTLTLPASTPTPGQTGGTGETGQPLCPASSPPSSMTSRVFSGTTWQLRAIADAGPARDVTSTYPIGFTVAGDTYTASTLDQTSSGPARVNGSSVCFAETTMAVVDRVLPPDFSYTDAMAAQARRFLELLPTMTTYRLSQSPLNQSTLMLSDGAGHQLTFTGVRTRSLAVLDRLVRGDGAAPGETDSIRAVRTTYEEFRAAAADEPTYAGTNGPEPPPGTRVWVVEWKGTFSIEHSCLKGSKSCTAKGTTFLKVLPGGWPPFGRYGTTPSPLPSPAPTPGLSQSPFEIQLFDETAGEKPPDLAALGTPILLPPF